MISIVPPFAIFIVGALLIPLFKGPWKKAYMLCLPVIGFINLIHIPEGNQWVVAFLEYDLVLGRIDRLSLLFGYIFHLISFIAILYALHVKDDVQHVAGLVYAGSALGAVFAGDLFTFFIFWEMLTVSSIFLIWARRTERSLRSGFRYLLVHSAGGLCLLAGIVIHVNQTGSVEFGFLGLNGLGSYLIFFGFGLNCAWPLLHMWLTDAYPEATITGTIFLSAFTTKVAVYALARAFPGTEALIWIGAVMTGFPIFYAVIENDLRRVLAYSLVNQVGFMVCGIGIGTNLAINGAVCHAFNDILFKALLFMSMGAVMYRTGKINGTDLGGLYRTMPWTCIFCMVGAASISAFPLFSGFVSKSMVMDAAAHGHMRMVWFILLFASAGVFHHAGIKIPYFAFFSHDSGMRPKEAPVHMLLAMGITAALCVFIGTFPGPLYSLLPYPVDYVPYTVPHVVGQTQLLFFSALAFTLLLLSGIYPAEMRCINLDADWLYRKGGGRFYGVMDRSLNRVNSICEHVFVKKIAGCTASLFKDMIPRVVLLIMVSAWVLTGVRGERLAIKKRNVYNDIVGETLPVGISAGVAALFIILIYVLI
ncbi:MAG: Na(+)/H(+) antiporter subunit D [Deltaproteobacteria bacterium]|nr:Na(+)/H(+) antiporter subunit D [Deltaproteobacteria bacterium]MCF8120727.1 Na(+)/H(+) antiporter subunit D [Deltaproteobacteria bacterium]